jgi:hypothetical protein
MTVLNELASISAMFQISGSLIGASAYGDGHIHDSYVVTYEHEGVSRRYLHQRINHSVFVDPPAVMENIQRITDHMRRKLSADGRQDAGRRTMTLIPTRTESNYLVSDDGVYWRTYAFIERTQTHQTIESPKQAYQAARAFGNFQRLLSDLPGPRLAETIQDFHNTPKRFEAFDRVVEVAPSDLANEAQVQIAFARKHEALAHDLEVLRTQSRICERITHNDTKLNNVLFDADSGEAICVVDLDTVMPGLSLYDFGDMVRTMTCPAAEDETDLSCVEIQVPLFEALVSGYLESTQALLSATEVANLVSAGKTIIFEQGLRFLTDHLVGDVYYKTEHPGQNLDRCRTQFKLIESIFGCERELEAVVAAHVGALRTTGV